MGNSCPRLKSEVRKQKSQKSKDDTQDYSLMFTSDRVNNLPIRFIVDTGAFSSLISKGFSIANTIPILDYNDSLVNINNESIVMIGITPPLSVTIKNSECKHDISYLLLLMASLRYIKKLLLILTIN
jgi:hypothetical protein